MESATPVALLRLHLPEYQPEGMLYTTKRPISIFLTKTTTLRGYAQCGRAGIPDCRERSVLACNRSVGEQERHVHCQHDVDEQVTAASADEEHGGGREDDCDLRSTSSVFDVLPCEPQRRTHQNETDVRSADWHVCLQMLSSGRARVVYVSSRWWRRTSRERAFVDCSAWVQAEPLWRTAPAQAARRR